MGKVTTPETGGTAFGLPVMAARSSFKSIAPLASTFPRVPMIRLSVVVAIALLCLAAPICAQTPPAQVTPRAADAAVKARITGKKATDPVVTDHGDLAASELFRRSATPSWFKRSASRCSETNTPKLPPIGDLTTSSSRAFARRVGPTLPVRRISLPARRLRTLLSPCLAIAARSARRSAAIVSGIAANAGCERYLVITRFSGKMARHQSEA